MCGQYQTIFFFFFFYLNGQVLIFTTDDRNLLQLGSYVSDKQITDIFYAHYIVNSLKNFRQILWQFLISLQWEFIHFTGEQHPDPSPLASQFVLSSCANKKVLEHGRDLVITVLKINGHPLCILLQFKSCESKKKQSKVKQNSFAYSRLFATFAIF